MDASEVLPAGVRTPIINAAERIGSVRQMYDGALTKSAEPLTKVEFSSGGKNYDLIDQETILDADFFAAATAAVR